MLSTMREKYHGKYHRFAQPAASAGTKVTYQLQLNGAYFPHTRSVSLNGYVNTQNTANSTDNLIIFAECSSALRVGAGRQVEVIV